MKQLLLLLIFLFLIPSARAEEKHGLTNQLTAQEIERVRVYKQLLSGVDSKTLQATVDELEKTDYPEANLSMKEAMAKTYADIVSQQNIINRKKKECLYSMVTLNMAYLQLNGFKDAARSSGALNRLICRKLKEYLPSEVLTRPGFKFSIE